MGGQFSALIFIVNHEHDEIKAISRQSLNCDCFVFLVDPVFELILDIHLKYDEKITKSAKIHIQMRKILI